MGDRHGATDALQRYFIVTAFAEAATGLVMVVMPGLLFLVLLGVRHPGPEGF